MDYNDVINAAPVVLVEFYASQSPAATAQVSATSSSISSSK